MLNEAKKNFEIEVRKFAIKNVIKKLQKHEIDYKQLDEKEFNSLIDDEIEILKRDSKKVGAGIGIGILISMITGI